jgi:ATP-dependent helicase/nuclease subunit B
MLQQIATEELTKFHEDPALWSFWWPRFARICDWLVQHETNWRQTARPVLTELKGAININGFTLEATPDRIDQTSDGAAIIDYKSGGAYNAKDIETARRPQLPLEALILNEGGFPGLPAQGIATLQYWIMTGRGEGGEIVQFQKNLALLLENTKAGLENLIATFADPATPYYSLPRPANAPPFNDYEHLARIREWSVASDTSEGEAA